MALTCAFFDGEDTKRKHLVVQDQPVGLREAGGERRREGSPSTCTVAKLLKEGDVPEAMLNVRRLGVSGCEEKRKKPLCRRRTPSCTSPLKQFAPTDSLLRRGRSVL